MSSGLEQRRIPVLGSLSPEALLDFVETSTIGLHAVGADGTILWANAADHELLGRAKEEYVGHNIAEFHADVENLSQILTCLTRGERLVNRRAKLRHKDGSLRHVLIDSSAYFVEGEFVHTRCFTRDVTALTDQTELNDAMIRAQSELGDGVILCDDERVYWANDAYGRLLGYTRDEILAPGFRLSDRLASESQAQAAQRALERELGNVLQHRYDAVLLRKDGSRVHCDISVKTLSAGREARRIAIVRDVTARAQAEQEMREQRDLYEAFVRSESELGQGVFLTLEGRVVYANDAFAAMVGRSAESLSATSFHASELFAPGEMEALVARLDFSDSRARHHYETTLQKPDGRRVRVEVASVGFELRGKPHRLALCRDVTRERDEQGRLKARDEFLTRATLALLEATLDPDATLGLVARLATEHLADAANVDLIDGDAGLRRVVIVHADPAKQPLVDELRANHPPHPEVRRLLQGIPRGEVRITNGITRDRIERYTKDPAEVKLALAIGYAHSLIVPLWGRRGLLGALTFTRGAGPAYDAEDAFVAKSLAARAALAYENALLHDATRKLEAEWRSLYERHQRILDTAPAQVLTINAEGRILSINRSVRSEDPKLALNVNAFDTIVPHDRERVRAIILDSMERGAMSEYETQAFVGPGQIRWFHVRVGPLELDGEKGAVLMSTDIEDKKRIDREIASMRAQLIQGEKLSALGSLVSGVAHELRTPLTFLGNNAFLLGRRLDDAREKGTMAPQARAEAEAYLREITTGVDRINQLVEDLRRYTKARHESKLSVVSLDEAVGDSIELFRATTRASQRVDVHLERTAPIRVNVGSVQQIVLNLLQNAADATPPGGNLRVSARDEGDGVVLEISDEGAGIAPDVQQRMFEPLFTTKPEGTGLGLSIVKRIVDEHRATISCESAPGRGTTFRVRFPRAG